MTNRHLFRHHLGSLVPADAEAQAALAKLKGKTVLVEIRQARNPRQHRLYWALMSLIHEHQERYATVEQLSNMVKCAVGWCDEIELKDGRVMATPKSISFANMKQADFDPFLNKVITLVCERILPGVQEEDLRRRIEEMVR